MSALSRDVNADGGGVWLRVGSQSPIFSNITVSIKDVTAEFNAATFGGGWCHESHGHLLETVLPGCAALHHQVA